MKVLDKFVYKHLGYNSSIQSEILKYLGVSSQDFISKTIGRNILDKFKNNEEFNYKPLSEHSALENLKNNLKNNDIEHKCYIGQGFYNTFMPYPIKRYILNNPKWYTPYTPYQAEINQGKLELLNNFQNMICQITNMPLANCGLLDEVNCASETVSMIKRHTKNSDNKFVLISNELFPVVIEGIKTRCKYLGIEYKLISENDLLYNNVDLKDVLVCMVQYPNKLGEINNYQDLVSNIHEHNSYISCGTDLLACHLIKPPGDYNFDVVYGNCQRFGLSMGFGGPHSGFFATKSEFIRQLPGKLVGEYKDEQNNSIYRMALQTREQHIKKEKATSNICTSQVLLSNMACLYTIYHGEEQLYKKALYTKFLTNKLSTQLNDIGFNILNKNIFDTISFTAPEKLINVNVKELLEKHNILISEYYVDGESVYTISIDETKDFEDVKNIINILIEKIPRNLLDWKSKTFKNNKKINDNLLRNPELTIDVLDKNTLDFDSKNDYKNIIYNSDIFKYGMDETSFMRYTNMLIDKDYSLVTGMIPLGSCTMKLNASYQLEPLNWDELNIHPYVPVKYNIGYFNIINDLSQKLLSITGMKYISYQSCSGSMGEYSGLISIRKYIESKKEINGKKLYCLIPESAHGTNFASAKIAGYDILKIKIKNGEIDITDLENKIKIANEKGVLGCLMVTYPSTYGLFDSNIEDIINIIHDNEGQVYLDGANMNAVGNILSIGKMGFDVAHLNLHKTFCIPHGGGGPGMGPIVVQEHLKDYLVSHPYSKNFCSNQNFFGDSDDVIASSPFSSASILTIPYLYLNCINSEDLKTITLHSLLSSNYLRKNLENDFDIKYKNKYGLNSHEFIIDLSKFKDINITEFDVCKRLIDYQFYPPTMSWPVSSSMMIEPTESENINELNRFIGSLKNIKQDINRLYQIKNNYSENIDKNNDRFNQSIYDEYKNLIDIFKNAPYPINKDNEIDNLDKNYYPSISKVDDKKGDVEILNRFLKK